MTCFIVCNIVVSASACCFPSAAQTSFVGAPWLWSRRQRMAQCSWAVNRLSWLSGGGRLQQPLVLTRLVEVDNALYVYLWKTNPELVRFLSDRPAYNRPLANTRAFEAVAEARNRLYNNLLMGSDRDSQSERAQELVSVRDLDEPDVGASGQSRQAVCRSGGRRSIKSAKACLPRSGEITVNHGSCAPWTLRVLLEPASKAAALEATSENFRRLFELVDHDLVHGPQEAVRPDPSIPISRPAPRGEPGAREYWVRNRWLTKIKTSQQSRTRRPHAPVFKTLKRRRTDEAAEMSASRPRRSRTLKHMANAVSDQSGQTGLVHTL